MPETEIKLSHPAQEVVISFQAARRNEPHSALLLRGQLYLQRPHDLMRHLILEGKDIFQLPVVALGPDVVTGGGVYQLDINADTIPSFLDAAFYRDTTAGCRFITNCYSTKKYERGEKSVTMLDEEEQQRLAEADRTLVAQAAAFSQELLRFLDLAEHRLANHIPPERWWWYLDVVRHIPYQDLHSHPSRAGK